VWVSQALVRRIGACCEATSRLLRPLMSPVNDRLGRALQQGVNSVGWLSATAGDFLHRAGRAVADWELLVHRASELLEQRILARFRDMESTVLCQFSAAAEPFTIEQFLDYVRVRFTVDLLFLSITVFRFCCLIPYIFIIIFSRSLSIWYCKMQCACPDVQSDKCR